MKFILLVEGRTERTSAAPFLKRWLDVRLGQPVGISPVTFDGYADLARKVAVKARMHLEGPKQTEIIAVIALLDLYIPNFFPANLSSAAEKHQWGINHFQSEVNHGRFRMFFAVHEFEAWLLAQPDIFPANIRSRFPQKANSPETVNFQEPPAKMLERVYLQVTKKGYKKTTYGRQLFSQLNPETAAQKCPHLKAMLEEMLNLAQQAQSQIQARP